MMYINLIFLLLFLGCGNPSTFNPSPDIKTTYDINISYSIQLIKRELGSQFIKAYVTKDERNLLVYINDDNGKDYLNTYSLLDYDITSSTPKQKQIIIDHSVYKIFKLYPLREHKIIYTIGYKYANIKKITILDYLSKKVIRSYLIDFEEKDYINDTLTLDANENNFFILGTNIDIHTIYKPLKKNNKIYRDNDNNIVIDPLHNRIWQDDSQVTAQSYDQESAQKVCKHKDIYNWRIPTIEDIETLFSSKSVPFDKSIFKYTTTPSQSYISIIYWLNYPSPNTNQVWVYQQSDFSYKFNTPYDAFVRCVADLR